MVAEITHGKDALQNKPNANMSATQVVAREIASCIGAATDVEWHPDQFIQEADRILATLEQCGWGKKSTIGQLSSTETIRLIIQSWIDQSTKECRESGFEPNDDTHIRGFAPHCVSHAQMEHWINVIAGIEGQRDALQRQLDGCSGDRLLTVVFNNVPPAVGQNVYLTVANRMAIARSITAAIEAARG